MEINFSNFKNMKEVLTQILQPLFSKSKFHADLVTADAFLQSHAKINMQKPKCLSKGLKGKKHENSSIIGTKL